jgi:hypothetical protein
VNGWAALIGFLASLGLLALFSRGMIRLVQALGWLFFGDERAVYLLTYVIFLPGVIIHELSHWVMAWLLGQRPRQLSIWPKVRGKRVEMGSVRVSSGGALKDSLTGMAPLVVGSLIVLLVSTTIFGGRAILEAWESGGTASAWLAFWAAFDVPNAWLWAYLVFTVSNAMLPSASDRQPVLSVVLFVALVGVFFYVAGWLPRLAVSSAIGRGAVQALRLLTTAFAFTVALDLIIAVPLGLLCVALLVLRRRGVE